MEQSFPKGPAFEVIVQPPKTHFLTSLSETKIVKITDSVLLLMSSSHTHSFFPGFQFHSLVSATRYLVPHIASAVYMYSL